VAEFGISCDSVRRAMAVLALRAVIANGDFDACWRFHPVQEHQRVHQARYQGELGLTA
jgi:hypothetical protein